MNRFPTVGIIGAGELARMMVAPAAALGINLLIFAEDASDSAARIADHVVGDYKNLTEVLAFARKCDVVTFASDLIPLSLLKGVESAGIKVYPTTSAIALAQDELKTQEVSSSFEHEIAITVSRSPHGQATTWAPVEIVSEAGVRALTITPAPSLSPQSAELAQKMALDVAHRIGLVGVMTVELALKAEALHINELVMRVHHSGYWSIDGAVTSHFEQHLRAILDLPLGSPAMRAPFAVVGNIIGGDKRDMYRPYLHLMARNPALRFHQYQRSVEAGQSIGHVTAYGDDLSKLLDEIRHARDYMIGTIDE